MKKLFLTTILIYTLAIAVFSQDIEGIEESKKLGLVSYLTFIKSVGESQMTILASNEKFLLESEQTKQFISNYNLLKLSVDKLINQMSADMYLNNRLRL